MKQVESALLRVKLLQGGRLEKPLTAEVAELPRSRRDKQKQRRGFLCDLCGVFSAIFAVMIFELCPFPAYSYRKIAA